MIKYNNTNNASTTLTAWISPSSTTLIVENGDILPTAPFLLTLEHFDNEKVTVREIVKCIAKAWNILTIQRGAWTCVQDDSATPKAQNNTPHSFSVWDCASIYWTSEQVQDIQNEIEKKLNIDDFQAWTYVYGATSTETDAYSITIPWTLTSYAVGQVFRFMADVDNEWNATLNINGLWAVEIRKNHDKILDNGDIEAGQIVEVAYDWTYFQMDSQVATVVDLWNIDSLKMSGVVGELYTLDDELYLQDVSEDLDLTQPVAVINVWYDKEEVHIQRIANGISGNSVSLYIAKFWSPVTNFNVEIRKGIYAEADWRAYWTGDETQILASKSISYSSFTEVFQKITITFDDDIELQRGDLIDVVCYQSWISDEKIKSTTNYFIIWWYVNQWWEWNSANYVDNGTVTKTNSIMYCYWDFLNNQLFSKVDYTQKNIPLGNVFSADGTTINVTRDPRDATFDYTNSTDNVAVYNFKCSYSRAETDRYFRFYYKIWDAADVQVWDVSNTNLDISFSVVVPAWKQIRVKMVQFNTSYNTTLTRTNSSLDVSYTGPIEKKIGIVWKAASIIPVSNETSIITEWNVNWEWYGKQPNTKDIDISTITKNTDFYLYKDAIMVCYFWHRSDYWSVATCKIKQDWNDYRIWEFWWQSGSSSSTALLNQYIEYRLRWWHTYQIDFNPSAIKEFYYI